MSSDTIIYVQAVDDRYAIWQDIGSNRHPQPEHSSAYWRSTYAEALICAHQLDADIGHAEYGVQVLKPAKASAQTLLSRIELLLHELRQSL